MKKVLLILQLLFSFYLFSQKPNIKFGETKIGGLGSDYIPFIGSDNENFYTTSNFYADLTGSFSITKYSSMNMNAVNTTKVQTPEINGIKTSLNKILLIDGKLILFVSQYDKNKNVNRLYACNVSADNVSEQSYKLISEIKAIDKKLKGFFSVFLSKDKKSLIVLSELPSTESDDVRYFWQIVDNNINIIWDKAITLPYHGIASDMVVETDYKNDKVYFIATNLKDDAIMKMKRTNGINKMYCYDFKQSKLTEHFFNIEKKSLFDLNINIDYKNQVVLTGLYSYSKVIPRQVFFNHTRELRTEDGAFCEVYSENIEHILYKDSIENGYSGFEYYVNDVFVQDDGSVFLVSENKEKVGRGNGTSEYDYYSKGVNIHYFNTTKNTKWIKRISKEQHEVIEGGCYYYFSTLSLIKNNNLFLIINDNKKNNLESAGYSFQNFNLAKNAETKIIKLDESGNLAEDKSVLEFTDSKNTIYCKTNSRINQSEMIVGGDTESGKRFARISLK